MYAFIKGKLITASPGSVVIEAGHIGFHIHIPAHVFAKLPQTGKEILLHTSFIVRELSQSLYGFLTSQEKELFEALLGITGVGPKVSLNLIGHLSLEQMQRAVANGDIAAICKVPGIGKKTAERLIVEMRDKLANFFPSGFADYAVILDTPAQNVKDAMQALINLGYHQNNAQKALKKSMESLPENSDVGALITEALRNL